MLRQAMKLCPLRGSLAVALAATMPAIHPLTVTAFSIAGVQQARSAPSFRSISTSRSMSKKDQSFPTWSFDEPCRSMAWTELAPASLASSPYSDDWASDADIVFVGVFAPKKDEDADSSEEKKDEELTVELSGAAKAMDEKLGGALSDFMKEHAKEFKNGAVAGTTTPSLRMLADGKVQRYVILGLGTEPGEDGPEGVGTAVGKAVASKCDEEKVATAKVLLPETIGEDPAVFTDIGSTFYATLYSDNRFRTGDKVKQAGEKLNTVTFVTEGTDGSAAGPALEMGRKIATGIHMTKDIVNAPHNILNSESLAETAKRLAVESGGTLKCTILGKEDCEARGMGACKYG
jgi:hypothetical protein